MNLELLRELGAAWLAGAPPNAFHDALVEAGLPYLAQLHLTGDHPSGKPCQPKLCSLKWIKIMDPVDLENEERWCRDTLRKSGYP